MEFLIRSSTGVPLPQEALRRIVEAVGTVQGGEETFVVFQDRAPYDILSMHATEAAARAAVKAGLSYIGPLAPKRPARLIGPIAKLTGCGPLALSEQVSSVVLRKAGNVELAEFTVNLAGRLPKPESDIEAIFLTVSGLDRFMIPYLARVYGAEYAAARRRQWVQE